MRLLALDQLPALERRLKARLSAELEGWLEPGFRADSRLEPGEAVAALMRACRKLDARRAMLEEGFRELERLLSTARHAEHVRDHCMRFLAILDPDPARLKGDMAAFSRYMGPDAIAERVRLDVTHIERIQELAVQYTGLHAAWLPSGASGHAGELEEFLLERLRSQPRWQSKVAALGAFLRWALALPESERLSRFGVQVISSVTAVAMDTEENVWAQRAALDLLYVLRPEEGLSAAQQRLARPAAESPDDLFVRKHAVTLIAMDGSPRALAVLERLERQRDPSEFVRRSVMQALSWARGDAAIESLSALPGHPEREPSPQVRAQAVLELGRLALASARVAPDSPEAAAVVRALSSAVLQDPSPLVRRFAMEEAASILNARRESRPGAPIDALEHTLLGAIDALIERPGEPLAMRRSAATTREQVLVPSLAAWRRIVPAWKARIDALGNGESLRLEPGALDGLDLVEAGRVLAHLSAKDFGLSLERRGTAWWLTRGEAIDTVGWRLLHEATHPSPDKRQAFNHTTGRILRGEIRAPSGILGELTMTKVPGEKVFDDAEGEWRRYLPAVDDYLSATRPGQGDRDIRIFSSAGVTTIRAPAGRMRRLRAWWGITRHYAELAQLRAITTGAEASPTSDRYVRTFEKRWGFQTSFEPHGYEYDGARYSIADPTVERVFQADEEVLPAGDPELAASPTLAAMMLPGWLQSDYFLTREGNHVNHLAIYAGLLLAWFLGHQALLYRRLRQARARLPLVIGGWGTRGKSGSERLKAGLFHGLGHSVFSKTTGCEAMFIHSVPGMAPMELFLFRPYDKATIWEQHNVVRMADSLGAEVFLWECMALKPDFVFLLQHRWMRDDISTLTNAYPDHEDIQGPAGVNIPEVMCNFLGPGHACYTAEDQMLPILVEGARANGTDLKAIDGREVELLTEDVLSRFPYREHPKNIVMVLEMARALGIESDVALKEMADNVIPDLGVLKTYPMPGFQPKFRARTMEFANGMSANERRGTVENWRRMGYDRHDVEREPFVYIATVVNNRADRVARSKVFASVLVNDLPADCHVPIGTNLTGLYGYTMTSLEEKLSQLELIPIPDRATFIPAPLGPKVLEDWRRQLRAIKVRTLDPGDVLALLTRMLEGAGVAPEAVATALETAGVATKLKECRATHPEMQAQGAHVESCPELEGTLKRLREALIDRGAPDLLEEALKFFERDVRRWRSLENFRERLAKACSGPPADLAAVEAINQDYRQLYRGLFKEKMVVLHDTHATGDQVIDYVLCQVPPGMHVKIMGIQNIKGTGLGFVYRWISLDKVCSAVKRLSSRSEPARRKAIEELAYYGEYGILDAPIALSAIQEAARAPANRSAMLKAHLEIAEQRIRAEYERSLKALSETRTSNAFSGALEWLERIVDFLDSRHRRAAADQIIQDLIDRRIAHERAVLELRALTYRQKGGWLEKGLRKWIARIRK